MALRILRYPGVIRVSKPGIDVAMAAEKDLLISLGARNCQIIQRGFIGAPAPTNVDTVQGAGTFTFTIGFAAQATTPDLWAAPVMQPGTPIIDQNAFRNDGATLSVTFGTSSATVVVRASNGQFTGVYGLSYALYRKRVES